MKRTIQAILYSCPALLAFSIQAQVINASDNAGNYSSWPQTANNGSGFGNWSFNNTTPNGGYSGEFLGTSYTSAGGGINSGSGNAFGFYANGGASAEAQAILPFLSGSLTANQAFSIEMQDQNITDDGGQVGFSLQDSSGNNLFQFYFSGGQSQYLVNVGGTQVNTGVGYTADPLTLSFEQGAGDAWSFSISEGGTLEATLDSTSTGDLLSANDISQANLFSLNGGSARTLGDNDNLYFNNPTVTTTPEPSTLALGGMSGLAAVLFIRRRR